MASATARFMTFATGSYKYFDAMDNGEKKSDFIRDIVAEGLKTGKYKSVLTRFPPEPNGYLHIGHAKSICLNFGIAREFGGKCNLRFDDTNPSREESEYVESIKRDVKWLGFDWEDREFYASDYFEQIYECAVKLIKKGRAYVCDLPADEVARLRGTLTERGKESPYRNRSAEENLDLFARMRNGEFEDGSRTLRAKIDMASPNIHMRDPVVYRIMQAHHHRTGGEWRIYPMYDFAHCISDSIEKITHSICTLEFEIHRPLYDWFLDELEIYHSRQYEFARLNLNWTVMSKRKLLELVKRGYVSGWDDPRMPTISGMRRRGYPPEAIREFCAAVGVTKYNSLTDIALLEHCIRDSLNKTARRFMGVLNPLKLTIVNYSENRCEFLDAVNNPEDPSAGTRKIPFSKNLLIERDDFQEIPHKKFHRLFPGNEVRLRYGYIVKCLECQKDPVNGEIINVLCEYYPETRGGNAPEGKKIQGTIHWVSAGHARECELRNYNRLFTKENPEECEEGKDFTRNINPDSLSIAKCMAEPAAADLPKETRFQFERTGYFCVDYNSSPEKPVFTRTVTLKDSWAKIVKKTAF
jgi:glutaminyl-tRNA synthetase